MKFEKAIPIGSLLCFFLAILTGVLHLPWGILLMFSSIMFMIGILAVANYRQLAERIGKDAMGQYWERRTHRNAEEKLAGYISMGRRLGLLVALFALMCMGGAFVANTDKQLQQFGGNLIVAASLLWFGIFVILTVIGWFRRLIQ